MILVFILVVVIGLISYLHRDKIGSLIRVRKERMRLLKWANSPPMKNAATIIDEIYQDVNGMAISLDARKSLGKQDDTFLYGEAVLYSFADLLNLTAPKPNDVFYDLGSGVGKPVFMAALLHEFSKSCGIELLEPLHREAINCLDQFLASPMRKKLYPNKDFNIQFLQENILDADFSDADVVFINGTAFFGIIWQRILAKLCGLKVGTRIIVTSKCLDESQFQLEHHGGHLMSWGLAAVSVYKKIN